MEFNNKNILITGGSGFIGNKLIEHLIDNTNEINIINFDKTQPPKNYQSVKFIKGDLGIQSDLNKLNEFEYDYIFHQGAITDTTVMDEELMLRVNTESFHHFIKLAKDNKAVLVYASSAATYGNTKAPNIVGRGQEPTNIYGVSKLNMDKITWDLIEKKTDLKIVGLRYFNVYGPGEERKGKMASMMRQLFLQMDQNKNPRLFKYGKQKRDFVYIKDVIQANVKAALSGKSGVYNVGFGEARNFNDIVKNLNLNMGKNLEIEYFDNPYDFYQNHTEAYIKNDIGYQPIYNLEKGIKDYVKCGIHST